MSTPNEKRQSVSGSSEKTPAKHSSHRQNLQSETSTTETNANVTMASTKSGTKETYVPPHQRARSIQSQCISNHSDEKNNNYDDNNYNNTAQNNFSTQRTLFYQLKPVPTVIVQRFHDTSDLLTNQQISESTAMTILESQCRLFFVDICARIDIYIDHINTYNQNDYVAKKQVPPSLVDCNEHLENVFQEKHYPNTGQPPLTINKIYYEHYKNKYQALTLRLRNCYAHGGVDLNENEKQLIFRSYNQHGVDFEAFARLEIFHAWLHDWIVKWFFKIQQWANTNAVPCEMPPFLQAIIKDIETNMK